MHSLSRKRPRSLSSVTQTKRATSSTKNISCNQISVVSLINFCIFRAAKAGKTFELNNEFFFEVCKTNVICKVVYRRAIKLREYVLDLKESAFVFENRVDLHDLCGRTLQ
jgi:hypothetical protein